MTVPVQNPTYMLAPNRTFRPNGAISLGNIIVDPYKPHRTLSKPDPAIWTPPPTETVTERDWRLYLSKNRNFDANIWAQFLENIGLNLGTDHSRNRGTEYTTDRLDTEYFREEPSLETLSKLVQDPVVSMIMNPESIRCKPVYMITGVKIARGLTWSMEKGGGHGANVSVSADVVPGVSAGVGLGMSNDKSMENDSTIEGDVVFAYQLLKLEPKGWVGKKVLGVSEYRSKATFLNDQETEEEVSPVEIQASIPSAEELAGLGGQKAKVHRFDEEESCICISYKE